jgi:hypothetical protein
VIPRESVEADARNLPKAQWLQTRGLLARALSGLLALLLAFVCLFVAGDEALKMAEYGMLPHGPSAISPYLIALAGAVLLTFGVGQGIQLLHVGGDEREDARLWSQLGAPERGTRMDALDNKAIWTFRTWLAATFIAIAALHAILWRPLLESVLTVQAEAIALTTGTLFIAAFGIRWFRVIQPRDAQRLPPDRWISTQRWILQAEISTPGTALFMWIVGLAAVATVARGLMTPRPFTLGCILMGSFAAAILWGAVTDTIEAWRRRGRPAPVLRLLREQDHPLVFVGMLDFSEQLPNRTQSETWLAELRASYWVYGRWPWKTWFTVTAPLTISRDARSGTFRLVIDALPPPPSSLLSWSIRVYCEDRKSTALYFSLPQEALYLEESAMYG